MAILPFDDRDGTIWYDGQMLPWREAKTHVLTHGLHYGSCVFEGQRAYEGEVFKLEEHTDRLFKSAEIMGMKIPYTPAEINRACREVLASAGYANAYMRPVAFRGSEMMAVSAQQTKTHVAIATWEWPSMFDPAIKTKGIKLDIARWRRPAPDTAPCHAKAAGLYMICTLSKHEAEAKGCQDAMMYDYRGFIAEATGANMFFVQDGKLHTPTPDCFLDGITRRTVMDLARARQIQIVERHIKAEELKDFSECFITGTAAEVTPVGLIGTHAFTPGKITATLLDDYSAVVRRKKAA
jgi:branched-chain amino acid aminotransferase